MIKKLLILLISVVLTAYFFLAFSILDKKPIGMICQGVDINIMDSTNSAFINSKDVMELLKQKKLYPKGEKMENIYCKDMESILQQNPLIERSECYKTPKNRITVNIYQRIPILRVMTHNGEDYFIDNKGKFMPNGHLPSQLVIATGYINKNYARRYLTPFAKYLQEDDFWSNQIEQINVTATGELEIVPRVGDHIVFLGKPFLIKEKLARLKTFYEKGLNVVGWNKYSRISLEFNNQVICTKKEQ